MIDQLGSAAPVSDIFIRSPPFSELACTGGATPGSALEIHTAGPNFSIKNACTVEKRNMLQRAQSKQEGWRMAAAALRRKRLKTALAAAVAHPLRARILTILAERVASPSEIAREIGLDVPGTGYHVKTLLEANLIEGVGSRQVRGAVEHFYRAIQLPVVSAEQETERSPEERRAFAEVTLSIYAANAAHALASGTLLARADHHLTRVALNVDREGWEEMTQAYMELFERVYEIQAAAAKRLGESDEEPMRIVSFQSLFEMPHTHTT